LIVKIFLCFSLLLGVFGCAPTLQYQPGLTLQQNGCSSNTLDTSNTRITGPDSLRAEVTLTALSGASKTSASGHFYAHPGKRYKLDLYGFPGILGAAFLWKEAHWSLALYEQNKWLEGEGRLIPLPMLSGVKAPFELVFAPIWGQVLPPQWDKSLAGKQLACSAIDSLYFEWRSEEKKDGAESLAESKATHWRIRLNHQSGLPDTLWDVKNGFALAYAGWHQQDSLILPKSITCSRQGQNLFMLEPNKVTWNFPWKRNPYTIRPPE